METEVDFKFLFVLASLNKSSKVDLKLVILLAVLRVQMLSLAVRKRRRLEDLTESKTVSKFADLIGRGQISISAAADIARSVVS